MSFTPLGKVLQSVLKEQRMTEEIETYKVFTLWQEIVGENMAGHARPVRITEKTVYIETDDPMWLTQLRYMKRDILRTIEGHIRPGTIKDLKFFLKGF
jgi:predicted nucleic acid-binding Zn ribbon protein